jgi:uncharacterized protein (DUF2141 family)
MPRFAFRPAQLLAACTLALALPSMAIGQTAAVTTTPSATGTYTLTVTVEGVESADGMLMAGLLKANPAGGRPQQAGGMRVQAVAGTTTITFTGLTAGDYAVRLFHDANGNGEMDSNAFGLPLEGYGFSNRARAGFGPPSFDEMKVTVSGDTATTAVMAY